MPLNDSAPIAVIADIHGNVDALRAVLADIDALGIGQIVNLGDHLSGPLAARETADLVMLRDMHNLRGNHDRLLCTMPPAQLAASDASAYAQLAPEHLEWLADLPGYLDFDRIFACHGTPSNDDEYWLEEVRPDGGVGPRGRAEVVRRAADIPAEILLCAHTHIPRMVRLPDARLVLNPGSVGCPAYSDETPVPHRMQVGHPAANYAVVQRHQGSWQAAFRSIPYDTSAMVARALAAGRDEWAMGLREGWLA